MKLYTIFLALAFAAAMTPASASAEYQGQITFSGSVSSNGSLYVETRDGGGPLSTVGPIPLSSGQSATAVANNCESLWTIKGCFRWGAADLYIYEYVPFTIWGSTNGSSWTQITSGSPYSTNGITLSVPSGPQAVVPTLAEWGLILLAGIILGTGVWTMQRRRRLRLPV